MLLQLEFIQPLKVICGLFSCDCRAFLITLHLCSVTIIHHPRGLKPQFQFIFRMNAAMSADSRPLFDQGERFDLATSSQEGRCCCCLIVLSNFPAERLWPEPPLLCVNARFPFLLGLLSGGPGSPLGSGSSSPLPIC